MVVRFALEEHSTSDSRHGITEEKITEEERPSDDVSHEPSRTFHAQHLRGNLMREHRNRDPLFYYDVITVLGAGSMGSVVKVHKRDSVIGGSARAEFREYVKKENALSKCFQIPLVGPFFHFCFKGVLHFDSERSSDSTDNEAPQHARYLSRDSLANSLLRVRAQGVEDYNDGHGEPENSYEMLYAMKSIHLSRVSNPIYVEELKNEIDILRTLDHPYIIKAIETFNYQNQIFIAMELCSGGDLYSRDPYTEEEAARITSSILSAVSYMHSRNVCHRDLKYENILFVNNSPKAEIKLIDFGLSLKFGDDVLLTENVGTIYTMAPEVFKRKYTKAADLWSVGVITYMLLSSQMPFFGRKKRDVLDQIMEGKYVFTGRRWKRTSQQAKDFVSDLLVVDPEDRATVEESLSKAWLNRRHGATVRNPYMEEEQAAQQSLMKFSKYSKLKKIALMVVAHKSTSTEIGILRKIFQKYDKQQHGYLEYEDFKAAIRDTGVSEKESHELFEAVDLDGSGKIRYTEFLAATIEARGAIGEERLAEAFDRIDSDDTGFISPANLREILGEDFPLEEIDEIMKESDLTKDGRISYAEFLAQWEDQLEQKREEAILELERSEQGITTELCRVNVSRMPTDIIRDQTNLAARVSFIQAKQLSERRAENAKHVTFQEQIISTSLSSNEGSVNESLMQDLQHPAIIQATA